MSFEGKYNAKSPGNVAFRLYLYIISIPRTYVLAVCLFLDGSLRALFCFGWLVIKQMADRVFRLHCSAKR